MAYNRRIHHRRSIRLQGYDYTQPGAYFVTIVANQRLPLFGEIAGGAMRLNACGEIVRAEWLKTAAIRSEIALDEFIIMPNHFHAIIRIVECGDGFVGATGRSPTRADNGDGSIRPHGNVRADGIDGTVGLPGTGVRAQRMDVRATRRVAPTLVARSIGAIMAQYKSITTKHINQIRGTPGAPVWQRNYWERIVRNGDELSRIREYIHNNPMGWDTDEENIWPDGLPPHGRGM